MLMPPIYSLNAYKTALESPALAQKIVFLSNRTLQQVDPLQKQLIIYLLLPQLSINTRITLIRKLSMNHSKRVMQILRNLIIKLFYLFNVSCIRIPLVKLKMLLKFICNIIGKYWMCTYRTTCFWDISSRDAHFNHAHHILKRNVVPTIQEYSGLECKNLDFIS